MAYPKPYNAAPTNRLVYDGFFLKFNLPKDVAGERLAQRIERLDMALLPTVALLVVLAIGLIAFGASELASTGTEPTASEMSPMVGDSTPPS